MKQNHLFESLKKLIGYQITIYSIDGKQVDGILTDVKKDFISIKDEKDATFFFNMDKIQAYSKDTRKFTICEDDIRNTHAKTLWDVVQNYQYNRVTINCPNHFSFSGILSVIEKDYVILTVKQNKLYIHMSQIMSFHPEQLKEKEDCFERDHRSENKKFERIPRKVKSKEQQKKDEPEKKKEKQEQPCHKVKNAEKKCSTNETKKKNDSKKENVKEMIQDLLSNSPLVTDPLNSLLDFNDNQKQTKKTNQSSKKDSNSSKTTKQTSNTKSKEKEKEKGKEKNNRAGRTAWLIHKPDYSSRDYFGIPLKNKKRKRRS